MSDAPDTPRNDVRLFIALPLSEAAKAELANLTERLRKAFHFTPCRPAWVKPEAIHLTLRFLGSTDRSRIEGFCRALGRLASRHAPIEFRGQGLGVFPDVRRPRVLWVGVKGADKPLADMAEEIEHWSCSEGYIPEPNDFTPHLTLARFRSSAGKAAIASIAENYREFRTSPVSVREIILFESELGPEGARHRPVRAFPLEGKPAGAPPKQ